MDENERREEKAGGPATAGGVGDEVAGAEQSGRAASGGPITAAGVASKDMGALKEIVRFKYSFDAGDQSDDGAHFLMMAPSWRPY